MKQSTRTGMRRLAWAGAIAAALALSACGGGGGSAAQGALQMSMTDAPACGYDHVYVTVEKVGVHASSTADNSAAGWQDITLPAPKQIDLLTLTNGVLQDLGATTLPAGSYQQVRLVLASNTGADPLANSVQPTGAALVPLNTPSAQKTGIKIPANITVQPDQTADVLLDFDACHSIAYAGKSGQYILKPVIQATAMVSSSIQGYVTTTMSLGATTVSAQQNGTIVRSTVPDSQGKFVLASLPAGTYSVVITSDGRATGVIGSVPVTTSTAVTSVSGTATAIVLPTSVMNTVTGTVTATTVSGSTTTTVPVGDATITALQGVSGDTVQVRSTPVDVDYGTYTLVLPAEAPVRAPYSTSTLTFTADTAAAGQYTLQSTSPTHPTLTQTVDVSGGAATRDFGY